MALIKLSLADVESKSAPKCEVCEKVMWWHGGTLGWGCPDVPGGNRDCRSTLFRPRPASMRGVWRHEDRYPELNGEG